MAAVPNASFLDPSALMRVRNLELRARSVVEGFWHGLHRSPFHGFSVEFSEYRPYAPGDDPRYLDWRLVARTDRYFIKKFEDETNLRCHLLVDASRSMNFGSLDFTKADYARTFAATLAYFLAQQGDATGLLTFDQKILEYLPAKHRPGHLRLLLHALEKTGTAPTTDFALPLRQILDLTRKRGLVILISDLLTPAHSLEAPLSLLCAAGHEVVLFHVLDPAELHFNFDSPARFQDLEDGEEIFLDPELARSNYLEKFQLHLANLRELSQRLGIHYLPLPTAQPLELALHDFLKTRSQGGKLISRRRGAHR